MLHLRICHMASVIPSAPGACIRLPHAQVTDEGVNINGKSSNEGFLTSIMAEIEAVLAA